MDNRSAFRKGMRDGIPIALGYFAVSFSLGIAMKQIDMTAFQGFLLSFTSLASAGEYAVLQVMRAAGSYVEIAIAALVANARYLLMSTALSQKLSEDMHPIHRFLLGYGVTDELFAISIAFPGKLNPFYTYGAYAISIPSWAFGTSFGILMGNVLPTRVVQALSVALFGMFLAIIIPPSKKDKAVAVSVICAFLFSYLCTLLPLVKEMSESMKTIVLTVVISSIVSIVKPHVEEGDGNHAA